jgi:LssY-like putative type I secretion system component LssY
MRAGFLLLAAAGMLAAASIPSGTQIQIRLTTALKTATDKANQPFEAVVIAPVVAGGRITMAAGAKVSGHIKAVTAANQADDQAVLSLAFDQISDGGRKASLAAKLVSVDNARESLDADGKLTGIKASETGSGRMDQGINKVTQKYPGLGDLLNTVKQTVVKETDANIDYEPGVEMTIELTKALEWTGGASAFNVKAIQPEDVLVRMVSVQPLRTMSEKPPRPSDITNMILLGSQQQIEAAFEKAGWSTAARLNSMSKLETFRALTEERGYKEAPVSTLLLDGVPPDLVYQKQNDTFAARHHLRIWHRPGKFNGQDIWLCSATHDTGIDFSQQDRTFIHKIDPQVDRERAKVVNDLLFTGVVRGLSLVGRDVPAGLYNATGDAIETDGGVAVILF